MPRSEPSAADRRAIKHTYRPALTAGVRIRLDLSRAEAIAFKDKHRPAPSPRRAEHRIKRGASA